MSEYGREGKEGGERAGQIEKSERERVRERERESQRAREGELQRVQRKRERAR